MSKSLRMLLLSMLVVVVAAMPAMATSPSRFYWTGNAGTNLWESALNWSADVALLSSDVSRDVSTTEYYPGNVKMNQKVKSLDVVISKDAAITVNQGLAGVLGISIDAKVTLDLGGYGYFVTVPNIKVDSGDFTLKGTRVLDINNNATWQGNKPITLDLNVLPTAKNFTLSIDNAALTINNASLLRNTNIVVSGEKGVLVLNVSPEKSTTISDAGSRTTTNAPRRDLSILLRNKAKIEIPADVSVTIDANRNKWGDGPVISGDLIKTGAGTLTLTRATPTASYDVVISSDVKKITVEAGTLAFTGASTITPASIDFAVAAGAKLVVGSSGAVYTNKAVRLTVSGDAEIAANGIGTSTSLYSGHTIDLSGYNLSADVRDGGTLTFSGTQPIKCLKGTGTVVASNGTLMLDATSKDIADFTGELKASIVGLNKSFDDLPFANASSDISAVHVYGGAELSLEADKLASVSGLNELGVYLRSNYDSVAGTYLSSNTVGVLHISGDITIGTLTADGSKTTPATVKFTSADKLTVSKLVLHANKVDDSSTQPTYSGVHAILISGDGTFNPKAIENAADDANLGSERAIEVTGGATLKLDVGVNIPVGNSLMLTGGTLEAANGLTIPVDLTIDKQSATHNVIKTTVVADNVRLYEGGHNAINVGGSFTLKGVASFDISLNDDNQSIGRKYRIIGPRADNFTKVVSEDASVDVVPAKKATMHADFDTNGVYVILDALMLQPRLLAEEWTVSKVRDIDFEARVSYDIPANVVPAGLINLVSVRVDIAENSFDNAGVTRQAVKGSDGKDLVYISSLKANSRDKEIVLVGTLYADELETKITLGWNKTTLSKDWIAYQKAGITYNGMDVDSRDFVAADTVTMKKFSNPKQETPVTPTPGDGELSEDVTAEDVVPEANVHTVTAGSQDVVLTVTGIRRLLTGSNGFVPVLVNGTYVWMNGYDPATEKFEMLYDGTYRPVSLDVKINGVSVNMASVDIEGSEPVTVTIPASFFTTTLAYTAPQEIVIVGTTANGHTITTEPISVWVKPASGYQAGTIDAGYVGRGTSDTEVTRRVADIPLGGTISFDVTGGTMPDEWLDADGIAAGVISFTVPAGTAAGVYTKTIDVYTAEGGYTYTFSYEVVEGFKINDPDEPYGTIGGLNYEARFTTNAPAGTRVDWDFPTNLAWLKSATSGDVFVVYGQLPAYVDDEEAEDDPNEYTYRVTATVSGDTITKDWTITVEEDTDEVFDHTHAAGAITFPEGKDIISADSTYSVDITFVEPQTDEIEFLSLPYWLKATPKRAVVDDEEVITGYTITYKEGTEVKAGETGVVRFVDPESDNIISWPVTFNQTIEPAPEPGSEFMYSVTGNTTVSVALAARDTSITITPRNVLGTVSYTSSASWVTVDSSTGVVAITPTDSSLVSATPHNVTITLTDSGRTTANTQTVPLTITVTSGGVTPTPGSGDQPVPGSEFMYSVTGSTTVSVALAARDTSITITPRNVLGTVSYTSSASWVTVDSSTGVVAINPTDSSLVSSTPHTVTITLTDSGRTTANTQTVTLTITVTSGGVQPVPSADVSTFTLSTQSSVALDTADGGVGTLTLSTSNALGTVSYSYAVEPDDGGLLVEISGNTVTLVGISLGTYRVVFTAVDSGRTESNTATFTTTVTVTSGGSVVPSVGSSGGGCDAGFGALALALAVPLFLRRRRS